GRTADLLARGIAQDQLVEVLIEHLRQLMLISACGVDSELIELSDDARAAAAKQAQQFDAPGLVHMIALCENLARAGKSDANPRRQNKARRCVPRASSTTAACARTWARRGKAPPTPGRLAVPQACAWLSPRKLPTSPPFSPGGTAAHKKKTSA